MNIVERQIGPEIKQAYPIRNVQEMPVLISREEISFADQVSSGRSGSGSQSRKMANNSGYCEEEFQFDMEEEMEARRFKRRINRVFVQEHAKRKKVKVAEALVLNPYQEIVKFVNKGKFTIITMEGRITRRKHSHDRSWQEKYDDYRLGSPLRVSDIEALNEDDYWISDIIENIPGMSVVRAGNRDWRRLKRSNAKRPDLTITSRTGLSVASFEKFFEPQK